MLLGEAFMNDNRYQSGAIVYDSLLWLILIQVVRPGGCVLFRDYGLYDHAMLRFGKGHKLAEQFYVRQDGTRAYYFTEGKISPAKHMHL